MNKNILLWGLFSLVANTSIISAQTIAEKKASLSKGTVDLNQEMQQLLNSINDEQQQKEAELHQLYAQVMNLYQNKAPETSYKELLEKINAVKMDLAHLEHQWHEAATNASQEESYALWHQPDTTLEQLVMDYGAQDYVYLIPDDIGMLKLSVASNLPIPRSAWNEMLELILTQNGVGIKQINPYLRELYLLQPSNAGMRLITNNRQELNLFPSDMRIAFMLTPEPSELRRIWIFLERFVNRNSTAIQLIGGDIIVVAKVSEIQDLLKLYDFVSNNKGDKEYRLVTLTSIDADQMSRILAAMFNQPVENQRPGGMMPGRTSTPGPGPATRPTPGPSPSRKPAAQNLSMSMSLPELEGNGLKIITLANTSQALFLIGTYDDVRKAESIIREVEGQLSDVREKVIYWYSVKNSDPEELAQVLYKIYSLMIVENVGREVAAGPGFPGFPGMPPGFIPPPPRAPIPTLALEPLPPMEKLYHDGFYQDGAVAINPAPLTLVSEPQSLNINENRSNFIVDAKSGAVVMVVEAEYLPKIKELIHKLDIPKKMVEIEVLLVERRVDNRTNYGLNLLRIGSPASNTRQTGITFNNLDIDPNPGITTFLLSRMRGGGLPAFDMIYKFLFSQDDIQINASPSITTVNQTPALIAIVDEVSIETGTYEIPVTGAVALKNAFTRAQYGITLEITPIIHIREEEDGWSDPDEPDYVTLRTNVTFDTFSVIGTTNPDQPDINRRRIENEVLIPDGQTVILGGLRRKNIEDSKDMIPIIGELPCIGKLFSYTTMHDQSVEMFIFITPKIIYDPVEDLERIRCIELQKRPGDIPEFLCCINAAREWERRRALQHSMQMVFGRPLPGCYGPQGEYDGR